MLFHKNLADVIKLNLFHDHLSYILNFTYTFLIKPAREDHMHIGIKHCRSKIPAEARLSKQQTYEDNI